MRVLFATAELSPLARVGGLAEASAGLVRALRDGESPAGEQRITWDGRDEQGARVAPGLYLARAEGNGRALVRRVCLLR